MRAFPMQKFCDYEGCESEPKYHIDLQVSGDDTDHIEVCVPHLKQLKKEMSEMRGYHEEEWSWVDKL